MDAFLDEVHKKRVSDEIRKRNKENKLQLKIKPKTELSRDGKPKGSGNFGKICY